MKYSYLIPLCFSVFLPVISIADPFVGDLNLTTQEQVNAAKTYTTVSGSLEISGDNITDLSPLSGITNVGTYIAINYNLNLTSVVDGFSSLTDVGWGIYVYNNENLVTFSGFDALMQTGDNIDFWYNDSLEIVSGFEFLQTAGWSLEFGGNPLLSSIPEFDSLLTISSSLFILDNPQLSEITGFRALTHVDWSFQIGGNSSLDNLCGFYNYFSNPYTGGGAFNIFDNGSALPNPTSQQDVINAGPCASAASAIENIQAFVVSLALANGIEKQLVGKLESALTALECGIACGASVAVAELEDFKVTVERQRGKKLSDTDATQLLTEADNIIALLIS